MSNQFITGEEVSRAKLVSTLESIREQGEGVLTTLEDHRLGRLLEFERRLTAINSRRQRSYRIPVPSVAARFLVSDFLDVDQSLTTATLRADSKAGSLRERSIPTEAVLKTTKFSSSGGTVEVLDAGGSIFSVHMDDASLPVGTFDLELIPLDLTLLIFDIVATPSEPIINVQVSANGVTYVDALQIARNGYRVNAWIPPSPVRFARITVAPSHSDSLGGNVFTFGITSFNATSMQFHLRSEIFSKPVSFAPSTAKLMLKALEDPNLSYSVSLSVGGVGATTSFTPTSARVTIPAGEVSDTLVRPNPSKLLKVMILAPGVNRMQFTDGNNGIVIGSIPAFAAVGAVFDLQMPAINSIVAVGNIGNPGVMVTASLTASSEIATALAAGVVVNTQIAAVPSTLLRILVTASGNSEMVVQDGPGGNMVGLVPAQVVAGTLLEFLTPALTGISVVGNAANPGVTFSHSLGVASVSRAVLAAGTVGTTVISTTPGRLLRVFVSRALFITHPTDSGITLTDGPGGRVVAFVAPSLIDGTVLDLQMPLALGLVASGGATDSPGLVISYTSTVTSETTAIIPQGESANTVVQPSASRLFKVLITSLGTGVMQFTDGIGGPTVAAIPANAPLGTVFDLQLPFLSSLVVLGSINNPGVTMSLSGITPLDSDLAIPLGTLDNTVVSSGVSELGRVTVLSSGTGPLALTDGTAGPILGFIPANIAAGTIFNFQAPATTSLVVSGGSENPGIVITFLGASQVGAGASAVAPYIEYAAGALIEVPETAKTIVPGIGFVGVSYTPLTPLVLNTVTRPITQTGNVYKVTTPGVTQGSHISSLTRVSNVVTAVTSGAHGLSAGQTIIVVAPGDFSTQTVIDTSPNPTTLTYAQVGADGTQNEGALSREPAWPAALGATVTSGSVIFTAVPDGELDYVLPSDTYINSITVVEDGTNKSIPVAPGLLNSDVRTPKLVNKYAAISGLSIFLTRTDIAVDLGSTYTVTYVTGPLLVDARLRVQISTPDRTISPIFSGAVLEEA